MKQLTFSIILLATLLACQSPKNEIDHSPRGVYRSFYHAVTSGNFKHAVAYLVPEAVDVFRRIGQQKAKLLGSSKDPFGVFIDESRAIAMAPLRKIETVSDDQTKAILKITAGPCKEDQADSCHTYQVALKKVDDHWLIEPEFSDKIIEIVKGE
jgi:hypothetical protein